MPEKISKILWFSVLGIFLSGIFPMDIFAQLPGYGFRKKYQVNSSQVPGSANLINFPVLFQVTDPAFRSTGNGGNVQNVNGFDIAFTSANGSSQLDHQLESYDPVSGTVIAWVRFPVVSPGSDTGFFVYYGNAAISTNLSVTSTWDNTYALVMHMNGNINDQSGNANNGTNNGTTSIAGKIANGRDFDNADFISIPSSSSLDLTTQATFSFWINGDDLSNLPDLITKDDFGVSYSTWITSGNAVRVSNNGGGSLTSSASVSPGSWNYVAIVQSTTGRQIYIDGVLRGSDAVNTPYDVVPDPLLISTSAFPLDGQLDEVRIANVPRSAEWIAAEFNNQNTPGSFLAEIPDGPVLSTIEGNNLFFTRGGSPVPVTTMLTVSQPFVATVTGATVQITGNYINGEDVLSFTNIPPISGNWNPANGTLTLTGTGTLAEYQNALRNVLYQNTNGTTPNQGTRTVTFIASNSGGQSNPLTRDINIVIDLNDLSVDLPSVVFHLDATDINGDLIDNQPANNTTVQTWGDRSDNAVGSGTDLSFTQGTAANRPLFSRLFLGERGSLLHDGSNDILTRASSTLINNATFPEKSFALVFRTGASVAGLQFIYEQSNNIRGYHFAIKNGTLYAHAFNRGDGNWGPNNTARHKNLNIGAVQPNTTYIVIAAHGGGEWRANVNNGSIFVATQAGNMTGINDQPGIGGAQGGTRDPETLGNNTTGNFQGFVSEIITWNASLSNPQFLDVFNFLGQKWLNTPPVLSNVGVAQIDYTEGDPATIISSSITITDVDNTLIDGAQISISNNYVNGEDVLSFTPVGGISGNFDTGTGVLTLSNQALLTDYQTALRSVRYQNTSVLNPTPTIREVTFQVQDWDDVGNSVSRNVNVISVNSTPQLANIEASALNYTEGDGAVPVTSTLTLSDLDSPELVSALISITGNFTSGEDELVFVNQNGISGNYNAFTGVLSLTGSSSLANYQTALRSVAYENTSGNPITDTRTVLFSVNDGFANSNGQSRNITVTDANSPPLLTGIEPDAVSYAGMPLQITNSIIISDPDDTTLDSAFVAITQNFKPTEDSLRFVPVFGITGSYNDVTGILKLEGTASLSDYQTALRTVLYSNFAAIPTGPERVISFTAHDGELAGSAVFRTINVTAVESINDLLVWLRADLGVVTSGSEVTTWQDQSGNGNDFTGLAQAGIRPTFVTSSPELNNNPAINFAGDGDHFEDPDGHTNYINGLNGFSLFVVIKSDQTNTDRGFWNTQIPNNNDDIFTIRYDESGANTSGSFTNVVKTGILGNTPANQIESFSDIQSTSGQIIELFWSSGTRFDIFIDGILNNPSAAGAPPVGTITTATRAIVGKGGKDHPNVANTSWDGLIAEVILYSRSLTTDEREKVEDYLAEKYSLSIRKITKASGGEAISADNTNTTFTALSGPVITEGFGGELANGGTLVLTLPVGFEFNTSASPSVQVGPAFGGSTTLSASFTSITASQATFTINSISTVNPGKITISGLQIRPTSGIIPNKGIITNTGTTGLAANTNFGDLAIIPGVRAQMSFTQQPGTANVNSAISPAVRVQLKDQFGNNVADQNIAISLALSSGTGNLSGTLPVNTNSLGIADFPDLQIDEVGTKQLTASSSGITSAVSSNFNIVNAGVVTQFIVERSPSGIISNKTAGQNFNISIRAADGTNTTVTTFTGSVIISSNCSIGTGAGTTANFVNGVLNPHTINITSVGNCSITATNSTGSESGTSNTFLVGAGAASASTSTISSNPAVILNNGSSTSTITVQIKDAFGNIVTTGGQTVVLNTNLGSLGAVTDNGNGTHTATLTSALTTGIATITGTLNAQNMTDNATVEFAAFTKVWQSRLGSIAQATNWNDGQNWSPNGVPGPGDILLIPSNPAVGVEFPVVSTSGISVAQVTLEPNARITVSGVNNFTIAGNLNGAGEVLGTNQDSLTVGGNIDVGDISIGTVVLNGSSLQTILNPSIYTNLTVDNPTDIQISQDFFVNGNLNLSQGTILVPSGVNFIANNKTIGSGTLRFQRSVNGVRGWRMLSSPVASTYGDLLDGTITQGFSGAFYSTGSLPGDTLQPNVLYYDETFPGTDNQRWRAPANATDNLTQGRGMFVFFFGDIPADPLYNDPLPDTLSVTGLEWEGTGTEVNFGITYTADADTGWNFVGNPFGATLNWNDNANWTKTNIESTIYVWDPLANGGNGEYLTWNGTIGTLGSGLIAPFQGFWIKAQGPGAVLAARKAGKTTGGNFLRKEDLNLETEAVNTFSLEVSALSLSKKTNFMFSSTASPGKDELDAFELSPFSLNRLEIYSLLPDGTPVAINHLPLELNNRMKIPLDVKGFINGRGISDEFTIRLLGLRNLPSDWLILLEDSDTGQSINLREQEFYTFFHNTKEKFSANQPGVQFKQTKARQSIATRFNLTITTEEIEANIPREIFLDQNFPNPFNPTTIIPFGLDTDSNVTLEIYDILGRKIMTLLNERRAAGLHQVRFDANGLASGIYIYRLQTSSKTLTKKLTLIR